MCKVYVIYYLPGSVFPRSDIFKVNGPFKWTEENIRKLQDKIAVTGIDNPEHAVISNVKNLNG